MRVLMVCRRYSGISRETWSPAGTPAVTKLIEELEARGHATTVLFLEKTPDQNSAHLDLTTNYGFFRNVRFEYLRWRGWRRAPALISDILNEARQFFRILPHLLRPADIIYF